MMLVTDFKKCPKKGVHLKALFYCSNYFRTPCVNILFEYVCNPTSISCILKCGDWVRVVIGLFKLLQWRVTLCSELIRTIELRVWGGDF